jgi:hypothetical protein
VDSPWLRIGNVVGSLEFGDELSVSVATDLVIYVYVSPVISSY